MSRGKGYLGLVKRKEQTGQALMKVKPARRLAAAWGKVRDFLGNLRRIGHLKDIWEPPVQLDLKLSWMALRKQGNWRTWEGKSEEKGQRRQTNTGN